MIRLLAGESISLSLTLTSSYNRFEALVGRYCSKPILFDSYTYERTHHDQEFPIGVGIRLPAWRRDGPAAVRKQLCNFGAITQFMPKHDVVIKETRAARSTMSSGLVRHIRDRGTGEKKCPCPTLLRAIAKV